MNITSSGECHYNTYYEGRCLNCPTRETCTRSWKEHYLTGWETVKLLLGTTWPIIIIVGCLIYYLLFT